VEAIFGLLSPAIPHALSGFFSFLEIFAALPFFRLTPPGWLEIAQPPGKGLVLRGTCFCAGLHPLPCDAWWNFQNDSGGRDIPSWILSLRALAGSRGMRGRGFLWHAEALSPRKIHKSCVIPPNNGVSLVRLEIGQVFPVMQIQADSFPLCIVRSWPVSRCWVCCFSWVCFVCAFYLPPNFAFVPLVRYAVCPLLS